MITLYNILQEYYEDTITCMFSDDNSGNLIFRIRLIDDDQTVLLMSYLSKPDLFELHKVSPSDWFVAFKEYNENLS